MAIIRTNVNLTAVTYVEGETLDIRNGATLTVDSTPTIRPGTITCTTSGRLLVQNLSTTTPLVLALSDYNKDFIFSGDGRIETLGAMIIVGTGTGALLNITALGTPSVPDLTYVEAERVAGSNEYFTLPLFRSDARFFNVGRTSLRGVNPSGADFDPAFLVAFYNQQTGTLTIGANGNFLPTGCRVRIPNILLGDRDWNLAATTTHRLITEGTPTAGNFTIVPFRPRTNTSFPATVPIAFNDTAANIAAALNTVLGAGSVTASGGPLPNAVTVTHAGTFATEPLEFTIASTTLSGGTNPVVYDAEANEANLCQLLPASGGDVSLTNTMLGGKVRLSVSQHGSINLFRTGLGSSLVILSNSTAPITFNKVCVGSSPFIIAAATNNLANQFGTVAFSDVSWVGSSPTSVLAISTVNFSTFNNVRVWQYMPRSSSTGSALSFLGVSVTNPLTGLWCIGGRLNLNLSNNLTLTGVKHADQTRAGNTTAQGQTAITITGCQNVVFDDVQSIGTAAVRNSFLNADANTLNLTVTGIDYNARANLIGGITFNGTTGFFSGIIRNFTGVTLLAGNSSYASRTPSASRLLVTDTPSSTNTIVPSAGSQYDLVSVGALVNAIPASVVGLENYVGGNFALTSTTSAVPTTGGIVFGPISPGASLTTSGDCYADGLGAVFLGGSGTTTASLSSFALRGITGFTGISALNFRGQAAIGTSSTIINEGGVTGGTFTVSLFSAANVLLGTTPAQPFNVTAANLQVALRAIPGANAALTVTGNLISGFTVFTVVDSILRADGSALTGGTLPAYLDYFTTSSLGGATGTVGLCGPDHVLEIRSRNAPAGTWGAWVPVNTANLTTLLPTGHSPSVGLNLELRLTAAAGVTSITKSRLTSLILTTNINPVVVSVNSSTLNVRGMVAGDTVDLVNQADSTVIATFTTPGVSSFNAGVYAGLPVYLVRKNSGGVVLVNKLLEPFILKVGDNGNQDVFYGSQVNIATGTVSVDMTPTLTAIAAVDTKVSAVDTKVTAANLNITSVQTSVTAVDTKVTGVDTKVTAVDTKVTGVDTKVTGVDTKVTGVDTKVTALGSDLVIVNNNVLATPASVLNATVEPGTSVVQSLRLANGVLGGVTSGAGTGTETFKSLNGTKDRVVSTVNTTTGERSTVTRDLS